MNLVNPIFFAPNRIWREYTGGLMLDRFVGAADSGDGNFPEDWLAATEKADNGENSQREDEGLGRICEEDFDDGGKLVDLLAENAESLLGSEHVANFGRHLAMQCKFVDPAVSLPVQCYPAPSGDPGEHDHDTGAPEACYIMGTRQVSGKDPYLLIGFKEGTTAEAFSEAVRSRSAEAVESMLHRLQTRPGETYCFPPRTPYAIGAGVFMLQVRNCAEGQTPSAVTVDQQMDAPDCTGLSEDELLRRVRIHEHVLRRSDEGYYCELVGSHHTGSFALWRAEVASRMQIKLPRPFALVICTAGEGRMNWPAGTRELRGGEYFLQPYGVPWIEYIAYKHLSLLIALPPMS